MLYKEFYFHRKFVPHYLPKNTSLGFSVRVAPIGVYYKDMTYCNDAGDMLCDVAVTFCSKKDKQFSKKKARDELKTKEMHEVRVKDLPMLLAHFHDCAMRWPSETTTPAIYNFIWRPFV